MASSNGIVTKAMLNELIKSTDDPKLKAAYAQQKRALPDKDPVRDDKGKFTSTKPWRAR